MKDDLTVISVAVGSNAKGFAIRVGPEISPALRLANCIKNGSGLIKYASNQYVSGQTVWSNTDIHYVIKEAIRIRNSNPTAYGEVRVNCTVA